MPHRLKKDSLAVVVLGSPTFGRRGLRLPGRGELRGRLGRHRNGRLRGFGGRFGLLCREDFAAGPGSRLDQASRRRPPFGGSPGRSRMITH